MCFCTEAFILRRKRGGGAQEHLAGVPSVLRSTPAPPRANQLKEKATVVVFKVEFFDKSNIFSPKIQAYKTKNGMS